MKGKQCIRQMRTSRQHFHKQQNDGKGQVTLGHIVRRKKIQGNVSKIIAGSQIIKTPEDWDMPQSATQDKYYPDLQVIQQIGTPAYTRN